MNPSDFAELQAQIERDASVKSSAIALLGGIQERLDAAVKAAIAANDNADLSAITGFQASLRSQTDALAAAVEASTPSAPVAPSSGEVDPGVVHDPG